MKQKNLCMVCIMLSLQKLTFYIFFHPMVMKEIEWENCSIIIQSRVTVYLENTKYILNWTFTDDLEFSILEYILPVQMLFVMTSQARKIDLNIPSDPDFHRYMGSKLEK